MFLFYFLFSAFLTLATYSENRDRLLQKGPGSCINGSFCELVLDFFPFAYSNRKNGPILVLCFDETNPGAPFFFFLNWQLQTSVIGKTHVVAVTRIFFFFLVRGRFQGTRLRRAKYGSCFFGKRVPVGYKRDSSRGPFLVSVVFAVTPPRLYFRPRRRRSLRAVAVGARPGTALYPILRSLLRWARK